MSMNKNTYPLHLAQANLRRWLDARVPLKGENVALSKQDHGKLMALARKWNVPVLIRKEGENNYSFILNEKNGGNVEDFYVVEANIEGDQLVQALHTHNIGFSQWKML